METNEGSVCEPCELISEPLRGSRMLLKKIRGAQRDDEDTRKNHTQTQGQVTAPTAPNEKY